MSGLCQMTLPLNGEWRIIFDKKNEGKQKNWIDPEVFESHPSIEPITVPSAWELIEQDYEGVAIYKKKL